MTELIYPTINLFLYNLRDGLEQTPEEITKNHNNQGFRSTNQLKLKSLNFSNQISQQISNFPLLIFPIIVINHQRIQIRMAAQLLHLPHIPIRCF
jgi:hypothetical protein